MCWRWRWWDLMMLFFSLSPSLLQLFDFKKSCLQDHKFPFCSGFFFICSADSRLIVSTHFTHAKSERKKKEELINLQDNMCKRERGTKNLLASSAAYLSSKFHFQSGWISSSSSSLSPLVLLLFWYSEKVNSICIRCFFFFFVFLFPRSSSSFWWPHHGRKTKTKTIEKIHKNQATASLSLSLSILKPNERRI